MLQFKFFRTEILGIVIEELQPSLNPRIEIDDFFINGFNSIEFKGVRLIYKKDTIVNIPLLETEIDDLFLLKEEKIFLSNTSLKNPTIKMIYYEDEGFWSLENIPKKSDGPPSKSDPIIKFNNLNILDGKLIVNSSNKELFDYKEYIDFSNLYLENFNLKSNIYLRPNKKSIKALIDKISFKDKNSSQEIKNLKFNLILDSTFTSLKNFELLKNGVNYKINASIEDIDIFEGVSSEDLHNANLKLDLNSYNIDYAEFMSWFGVDELLYGNGNFRIQANGNFNDIKINSYKIEFGESKLKGSGIVKNLISGDEMELDISVKNSNILRQDFLKLLELEESFPNFSLARIYDLKMTGTPKELKFHTDFASNNGNFKGNIDLDLRNKLIFDVKGNLSQLNIGNIIREEYLGSNINSNVEIKGLGTNPDSMLIDIKLLANNSKVFGQSFKRIYLISKIVGKSSISLDSIKVNFEPDYSVLSYQDEESFVAGSGSLKFLDGIDYDLHLEYNALDISKLLGNKSLPNYISGYSELVGDGFDFDKVILKAENDIYAATFNDRAFLPFKFDIQTGFTRKNKRTIDFNSDFGSISLEGDFKINGILSSIENQGLYLVDFFTERINSMIPEKLKMFEKIEKAEINKITEFEPINFRLKANINDISFASVFLDNTDLYMQSEIDFTMFASEDESSFLINKFEINDIYYDKDDVFIRNNGIEFKGSLFVELVDSLPVFSDFNLIVNSDYEFSYNDLVLTKPHFDFLFDGNSLEFNTYTIINQMFDLKTGGEIEIIPGGANLTLNRLDFSYLDYYGLSLKDTTKSQFLDGGFDIYDFIMETKNGNERLEFRGSYDAVNNEARNLSLLLLDFDLVTLEDIFPELEKLKEEKITGRINSLRIALDGKLDNPVYDMDLFTNDLSINNQMIGDLSSHLEYKDKVIKGDLFINHFSKLIDSKLIVGKINKIPLDLSIKEVDKRILDNQQVDMIFSLDSLPLSIFSPFVPAISKLRGLASGNVLVSGYLPNEFSFGGEMNFDNTSFLVDATNVNYLMRGKMNLSGNSVIIDNMELFNSRDDFRNGKAKVNGIIELKKMVPDKFNLDLKSNGFLVLNEASKKTMKNIYGDLIIGTGEGNLNFYGSLEEPYLSGNVELISGNLYMPANVDEKRVENKFVYITKAGDSDFAYGDTSDVQRLRITREKTKSLNELMDIDLEINFKGPVELNMAFNQWMSTQTFLGVPISLNNIRYEKASNSLDGKLFGKIIIKDGSKFNFFKSFDIIGEINFPTGDITNPSFDIKANYVGRTNDGRRFEVKIDVKGSKENPEIYYSYTLGGQDGIGEQDKIIQDVIFLLTFGRLKDGDITQGDAGLNQGSGGIQNVVASDLISREISKIVADYGLSASVELGQDFQDAMVKVRGSLIGGATWSFGSNVNDISGSEFQLEIPLNRFFGLSEQGIVNLILDALYVNSPETIRTNEDQIHWEFKMKLGGSW